MYFYNIALNEKMRRSIFGVLQKMTKKEEV